MYFQSRNFNVYFETYVRKFVSVVWSSNNASVVLHLCERKEETYLATLQCKMPQLKYLHFQRGSNKVNKHSHYAIYLYIWCKECIKMMSGIVPKKCLSPPPPLLRTVKCDQRFVNLKWLSHPHAPYYPASIKQYWNTGEEIHYRYAFKVYFINIYYLKLRRHFTKNCIMTIIQGVTGGTDQTSGGCSLC